MKSIKIIVRPLKASDYATIKEIERTSIEEYRRYLKKTGERDSAAPSVRPAYFQQYLKMGSSFVAEVDGRTVGYVLSQPTSFVHSRRRELWLEYIIVLRQYRRKGIGFLLLKEVTRWARKRNFGLLHTNLNPNNPDSARLLERHGFEVRTWKIASKILG